MQVSRQMYRVDANFALQTPQSSSTLVAIVRKASSDLSVELSSQTSSNTKQTACAGNQVLQANKKCKSKESLISWHAEDVKDWATRSIGSGLNIKAHWSNCLDQAMPTSWMGETVSSILKEGALAF